MELNIFEIIWSSGLVVKFVLLLLILASVYSWAVVFFKYSQIKSVLNEDNSFDDDFANSPNLDVLNDERFPNSSKYRLYKESLDEFEKCRETDSKNIQDNIERSLQKGINEVNEKLSKRLPFLASISSVAPFVGLFGTVWGIINSFSGLAQGGGTLEAVAPGIAEALVATAVGLAAAIPANWFYNVFSSKIRSINTNMNSFSQDLLNMFMRK